MPAWLPDSGRIDVTDDVDEHVDVVMQIQHLRQTLCFIKWCLWALLAAQVWNRFDHI